MALDHERFFALWARSDAAVYRAAYATALRPRLQLQTSRAFWDANGDELFAHNLFFAGSPQRHRTRRSIPSAHSAPSAHR